MNEDNAVLKLLDVLELKYKNNTQSHGKARTYCAISLRKKAKTVIESNGKTIPLSDRSLTFFPANTPYLRQSVYDDMIVIHFNSSVSLFDNICTINNFDYDIILERFEKALALWKSGETDKYYKVSALLYEIIAVFYKNTEPLRYSKKMQIAVAFIKENLYNPSFSVNDIAKHLNVCPTALRNLFKAETGNSPKRFITDMRMKEAASMLNSGYWSITETAERLGFSDQKNFSTAFKKYFGYSPSKQKYNYL